MQTWLHDTQLVPDFVENYWFLQVDASDTIKRHPVLLPDAHSHYVIAPDNQPYSYKGSTVQFSGVGSHLLGSSNQAYVLEDFPPILRIGIKFKPGACYALLSKGEAATLNNCGVNEILTTLLPFKDFEPLLNRPDYKSILINLMEERLTKLARSTTADRHYGLTLEAVSFMDNALTNKEWNTLNTQNIADTLSCSKRTLERSFQKTTGVTVKQYQTMEKLNALFIYLNKQDTINWADVADEFNFSDQAHLIRKLKSLIKRTPREYLNTKNMIVDVYGTFE